MHNFSTVNKYENRSISQALSFKYLITEGYMKFLNSAELVKIKLNAMGVFRGIEMSSTLHKVISQLKQDVYKSYMKYWSKISNFWSETNKNEFQGSIFWKQEKELHLNGLAIGALFAFCRINQFIFE